MVNMNNTLKGLYWVALFGELVFFKSWGLQPRIMSYLIFVLGALLWVHFSMNPKTTRFIKERKHR